MIIKSNNVDAIKAADFIIKSGAFSGSAEWKACIVLGVRTPGMIEPEWDDYTMQTIEEDVIEMVSRR